VHESARAVAELVVNFGIYAGREATPAEIERLARTYLSDVRALEVVCEHRYEFTVDAEATVYRIRVRAPEWGARAEELRLSVDGWARDCIGERRVSV
jgi:hypothetical protein